VPVGVSVGVLVAVCVGVLVGVLVGVAVCVGVSVGVFVGVRVGVLVGVLVGLIVGVRVGVSVGVDVGVSVALLTIVRSQVVDSVCGIAPAKFRTQVPPPGHCCAAGKYCSQGMPARVPLSHVGLVHRVEVVRAIGPSGAVALASYVKTRPAWSPAPMIPAAPPGRVHVPSPPRQFPSFMHGFAVFKEQRKRLAGVQRISLGVPAVVPVPGVTPVKLPLCPPARPSSRSNRRNAAEPQR